MADFRPGGSCRHVFVVCRDLVQEKAASLPPLEALSGPGPFQLRIAIRAFRFGAVSALSVTFMIPVFGTLWGAWILGESVTWATVIGGLLVLLGTAWATGFSAKSLTGLAKPFRGV